MLGFTRLSFSLAWPVIDLNAFAWIVLIHSSEASDKGLPLINPETKASSEPLQTGLWSWRPSDTVPSQNDYTLKEFSPIGKVITACLSIDLASLLWGKSTEGNQPPACLHTTWDALIAPLDSPLLSVSVWSGWWASSDAQPRSQGDAPASHTDYYFEWTVFSFSRNYWIFIVKLLKLFEFFSDIKNFCNIWRFMFRILLIFVL